MLSGVEASMKLNYFTNSSSQTKKLGEAEAEEFFRMETKKNALTLGLEGDLGGGKTTFLQGFARGLGLKEKILSPTFVILKRFKIKDLRFKNFYHIDCYRIKKPKELLSLGFKEIISNPQNIVAVEWADRIRKIMPKNTIWVIFEFINKNKRKIVMKKNDKRKTSYRY